MVQYRAFIDLRKVTEGTCYEKMSHIKINVHFLLDSLVFFESVMHRQKHPLNTLTSLLINFSSVNSHSNRDVKEGSRVDGKVQGGLLNCEEQF